MNSRIIWIVTLVIFASVGCKKREPNPHFLDPIYSDLNSEMLKYEKVYADAQKQAESAQKELLKTQPRTIDRKVAEKQLSKAHDEMRKSEELYEYYKIRVIQRKYIAKKEYDAAFDRGEPWPDPKNFEAYNVNKRLRGASRNWNDRVPKSNRHSASGASAQPAEKPAASGH